MKEEVKTKNKTDFSVAKMFADLGMGALVIVAGALAGAAAGRPHLAIGLSAAAAGYSLNQIESAKKFGPALSLFGLGMMVGNPGTTQSTPVTSVHGLEGFMSDAMERAKTFGRGIVHGTYLDELEAVKSFTGMGELTLYDQSGKEISSSQADDIIKKLSMASVNESGGRLNGLADDFSTAPLNGILEDY